MPASPLPDAALRPLIAAVAAAGVLTALASVDPGASAVSRTATATRTAAVAAAPAPAGSAPKARPATTAPKARPRAHVARTFRRGEWVRPVPGPVTSLFGRRWGSFHPGVDVAARRGTPVHAITAGRVISAGWIPGYGKVVRVRAGRYTFFYPHLSRILVRHGIVREDQVIGRVGSTGFSTGPHLHIEIRVHGHAVPPRPLLHRHGVHI